jgi:hypothetical protein
VWLRSESNRRSHTAEHLSTESGVVAVSLYAKLWFVYFCRSSDSLDSPAVECDDAASVISFDPIPADVNESVAMGMSAASWV